MGALVDVWKRVSGRAPAGRDVRTFEGWIRDYHRAELSQLAEWLEDAFAFRKDFEKGPPELAEHLQEGIRKRYDSWCDDELKRRTA